MSLCLYDIIEVAHWKTPQNKTLNLWKKRCNKCGANCRIVNIWRCQSMPVFSPSPCSRLSLCAAAGQVTSWSRSSKSTGTSSTWVRHQQKKPSEVSGAVPAHVCAPNLHAAAAAAAALFTLQGCLLIYRLFISPEKEPSLSSSANRAVSFITAKPLKEHG